MLASWGDTIVVFKQRVSCWLSHLNHTHVAATSSSQDNYCVLSYKPIAWGLEKIDLQEHMITNQSALQGNCTMVNNTKNQQATCLHIATQTLTWSVMVQTSGGDLAIFIKYPPTLFCRGSIAACWALHRPRRLWLFKEIKTSQSVYFSYTKIRIGSIRIVFRCWTMLWR